jgi:glucose-1-phosphate thymidylyltransferase
VTHRKGIILAGGSGTRLYPLTIAVSKQLLPVYDKPMIYYPLTVLMLAEISEILIITTPQDLDQFQKLLGDGSQWGIKLSYEIQQKPNGLAEAFILAEEFLNGAPSAMILGDNIHFGDGLLEVLASADAQRTGATIFCHHVSDPERYGVVCFDTEGKVKNIIEKPVIPPSSYAITGLYFVDNTATERAKKIKPSDRGELEIITLLESYLEDETLCVQALGRGFSWLDAGTYASLLEAGNFVRTITERQGLQVGSPEEVAYRKKWITKAELFCLAEASKNTNYSDYLRSLIN